MDNFETENATFELLELNFLFVLLMVIVVTAAFTVASGMFIAVFCTVTFSAAIWFISVNYTNITVNSYVWRSGCRLS